MKLAEKVSEVDMVFNTTDLKEVRRSPRINQELEEKGGAIDRLTDSEESEAENMGVNFLAGSSLNSF